MINKNVYGYVNGKPVYSRDEFIYNKRGFEAIISDEKLLSYAEEVTHRWTDAGWNRTFATYYLSDYANAEPYASLTLKEFERLKMLQKLAEDALRRTDEAREWEFIRNMYWADNSVEELWRDKDGIEKIIIVVAPNGDLC